MHKTQQEQQTQQESKEDAELTQRRALELQRVVELVQVYASAWALVGSRFDTGGAAMSNVVGTMQEIRQAITGILAQSEKSITLNGWQLKAALEFLGDDLGYELCFQDVPQGVVCYYKDCMEEGYLALPDTAPQEPTTGGAA